jgi:hypothetical protein
MNVFFLNADIVISPSDIELGEDPGVCVISSGMSGNRYLFLTI